jgi:hypothetical protein
MKGMLTGWVQRFVLGVGFCHPGGLVAQPETFTGVLAYHFTAHGPDSARQAPALPRQMLMAVSPTGVAMWTAGGTQDTLYTLFDSSGVAFIVDPRNRTYANFFWPLPIAVKPDANQPNRFRPDSLKIDTLTKPGSPPTYRIKMPPWSLSWLVALDTTVILPDWWHRHPVVPLWAQLSNHPPFSISQETNGSNPAGRTPPRNTLWKQFSMIRETAKSTVPVPSTTLPVGYRLVPLIKMYFTAPY